MKERHLFQGKRIDNEDWAEGYLLQSDLIVPGGQFFNFCQCGDKNLLIEDCCIEFYRVNPKTVRQHTGLSACWCDSEDNLLHAEIWEHDLLKVEYGNKEVVAEVQYELGMYILCSNEFYDSYVPLLNYVSFEDRPYVEAELVGNSFDNPELLKN